MTDQSKLPSTRGLKFPEWEPQLHAALLETDPRLLRERVLTAEGAIVSRMQALVDAPKQDAELHALEEARLKVRVLLVEKLNYPVWPGYTK
jgi:hypothetical protein